MEPGSQYQTTGYDTQSEPSDITEEPMSVQVIDASSDTLSPSNGEGFHHIGQRHRAIHSNIAQKPTEINLDKATMD